MKPKILVADDNEPIREGLKDLFLSDGCDVIIARDGKEAAELTLSAKPDLVIMDYHMPHKTGFEAVEEIRKYPSCANIPVIILTSDEDKPVKMKGLSLEIDDFILKTAEKEENEKQQKE
jgi:CheY-like chemotaxis protein